MGYKNTKDALSFNDLVKRETLCISSKNLQLNNVNWGLVFKLPQEILKIVTKLKLTGIPLAKKFPQISQGLIAYDKYQGQSEDIIKSRAYHYKDNSKPNLKEWLWGGDVTPYSVKWNGEEYVDYCDGIANPRNPKFFQGSRILIREITNPKIFAGYTNSEQYHDPAIISILASENEALGLLGILNSKLATFFHFNASPKATKGAFPKILVKDIKDFPLPASNDLLIVENIVKEIIETISLGLIDKRSALEEKLDEVIYDLYNLTEIEKEILREISY